MDNLYTYSINPRSRLQVFLQNDVTTVHLHTDSPAAARTAHTTQTYTTQTYTTPTDTTPTHTAQTHTAQTSHSSHSSHSFTTGQWQRAPLFTQIDEQTVTVIITADQTHHIHCQNEHLSVSSESAPTINNNSKSTTHTTTASTTVSSTTSATHHTTTVCSSSSH